MSDLAGTMRAAVLHGRGDLRVEDVPIPEPGPGDLLLKIASVGICGTDSYEYVKGPKMFPIERTDGVTGHSGPMIPGHEFSGVVEGLGTGASGFEEGALVVSGAGVSCGECSWCRRGHTHRCERYWTVGLERDGALAEYAVVPASTCIDVTAIGLSADTCALAQPMAIGVHAARRGRPEAEDVVVVIGAGGIGMFLVHALSSLAATIVVADLDTDRLSLAARHGATHTVDASDGDALPALLRREDLVPTLLYEVTGTATGLGSVFALMGMGTRLVIVGHQPSTGRVDLPALTRNEHGLIGTNAHQRIVDLPEAIRLLAARKDGWRDIAPVALPLDGVAEALALMAQGGSGRIKTLIDPWSTEPREATT